MFSFFYAPEHFNRGYVFRRTPLYGIRKWRGGGYARSCRTVGNKRLSLHASLEVQEYRLKPIRGAQSFRAQPDSHDGRTRFLDRSWKSQHKGRKSWDSFRAREHLMEPRLPSYYDVDCKCPHHY